VGSVTLRLAEPGDRDLILLWANEPATRAASFHPAIIDLAVHERWFAARLASPDGRIWIGEMDGRPIGQVRVIRIAGRGEISISLAAEVRGRGLARPLLTAALAETERDLGLRTFVAAVRHGNAASLALFRGADFCEEFEGERDGVACTVLVHQIHSPGPAS